MSKILVLYTFHKYSNLVKYFIENAIFKDDNVDFLIISNDKNIKYDCPSFVKKIYRDNIGFDFGGWSEGLFKDDLYKNYDYFIFANSSVLGPFLPRYYNGKWTDIYINSLNDNVKLFGSSINTCINNSTVNKIVPHVQSYIFSMNKETLEYLISNEIFSLSKIQSDFNELIMQNELRMSSLILEKKWNIGSLLPYYKDIDFTNINTIQKQLLDDIMFQPYYNIIWNEYDLVFIKGNRINLDTYFKLKR